MVHGKVWVEALSTNENRIAYFAGCAANYNEPEVGSATISVLEKNGLRPIFPDQKCCGAPKLYYGRSSPFRKDAGFNIRALWETGLDIITDCPTCAVVLKYEYPKLLKSHESEKLSKRVFDVFEYLAILHDRKTLDTGFSPVNLRVSYYAPCHLKAQGESLIDHRQEVIRLIPGVTINLVESGCCGMGGTFGAKSKHYEQSLAIGQPLFEELKGSSPDLVATDCLGCKLQIQQGTGLKVTHPINIVRQAYGL